MVGSDPSGKMGELVLIEANTVRLSWPTLSTVRLSWPTLERYSEVRLTTRPRAVDDQLLGFDLCLSYGINEEQELPQPQDTTGSKDICLEQCQCPHCPCPREAIGQRRVSS